MKSALEAVLGIDLRGAEVGPETAGRTRHKNRNADTRGGAWAGAAVRWWEEVGLWIQSEGRAPSKGDRKGAASRWEEENQEPQASWKLGTEPGLKPTRPAAQSSKIGTKNPAQTSNAGPQRAR